MAKRQTRNGNGAQDAAAPNPESNLRAIIREEIAQWAKQLQGDFGHQVAAGVQQALANTNAGVRRFTDHPAAGGSSGARPMQQATQACAPKAAPLLMRVNELEMRASDLGSAIADLQKGISSLYERSGL